MADDGGRRQDTFGLREIGLTLSNEQGDAASLMYTADASVDLIQQPLGIRTQRDAGTGIGRNLGKKKVTRYFPGQQPQWVKGSSTKQLTKDDVFDRRGDVRASQGHVRDGDARNADPRDARGGPRAGRVAHEAKVLSSADAFEEAPKQRRAAPAAQPQARVRAEAIVLKASKQAAPVAEAASSGSSSESDADGDVRAKIEPAPEDDDEVAERRARVRAKLKAKADQRRREEEEDAPAPPPAEADADDSDDDVQVARRAAVVRPAPMRTAVKAEAAADSSDDESSAGGESSDESDSDDSDAERARHKPLFVPRAMRATIDEAVAREEEEAARRARDAQRKVERAEESRALVADVVMRSEAAASAAHFGAGDGHGSDFDAPDDADDLDDPLEFEAWRVRELARATREKDARELAATDEAETERRRALTPEARAREDRETGKGAKPEKAERRFLQKYHHKGAFYMDDDTLAKAGDGDVRKRATDGPTGADKFDRAALPSVLQVKDFGFAGRTKYTHLTDQDTTFLDKDNPFNGWAQRKAGDPLRKKFDDKMGGVGDIDKAFQRKAKR